MLLIKWFDSFNVSSRSRTYRTVKAILAQNPNIEAINNDGNTALMLAAQKGHTDIFNALLAKNPNIINAQNKFGATALYLAVENEHPDTVNALLNQGANTEIRQNNGWTALMFAAQKGHAYIFNALLAKNPNIINAQNNEGWTALMIAAEHGHTGIVNTLLQRGANLDLRNNNGDNAFHIALRKDHNEVHMAIFRASINIVTPSRPIFSPSLLPLPENYFAANLPQFRSLDNPRLSRDFFTVNPYNNPAYVEEQNRRAYASGLIR